MFSVFQYKSIYIFNVFFFYSSKKTKEKNLLNGSLFEGEKLKK